MAQRYTPIWDDWPAVTQELNDQEKGRLIDAIIAYDNGGDWKELIKGNERYVFPGYQVRIDRWKEVSEGRSKAGYAGGKQSKANLSKTKQTEANESKSPKVKDKDKEKDIDNDDDNARVRETAFGEVEADPVIISVQSNLTGLTVTHYNELAHFREILGDDLVIHAIDETVGNGARSWNYTKAILEDYVRGNVRTVGEAKERSEKRKRKQTPAQTYTQRQYSEADLEARITEL